MDTKFQLQKERDELASRIENINKKITIIDNMCDRDRIADTLHSRLCGANHIDQCAWTYESWEHPGHAKKEYMKKAEQMLVHHDEKTIMNILRLL